MLHGLQHAELNGELRVLTLIQLPDQRLQHPQGRPLAATMVKAMLSPPTGGHGETGVNLDVGILT